MRAWLAVATAAVAVAACTGQTGSLGTRPADVTVPPGVPSGADPVVVRPVFTMVNSGITDARQVVIRDGGAWQTFWQDAADIVTPTPPAPEVNFNQDMVIVASLGQRPTGGYGVSIEAVYSSQGQLYVVVRETAPAPGSIVTQSLTAPVVAVAAPRSDAAVVFVPASGTNP